MKILGKNTIFGKLMLFAAVVVLLCTGCTQPNSLDSSGNGDDSGKNDDGIGVSGEIHASDIPSGWASVDAETNFGGYGYSSVTVSSRNDLMNEAKAGNKIIYISGMIDMSSGMLPSTYNGTTSGLNSLISEKTGGTYTTYEEWRTAYAASCKDTADGSTNKTLAAYQAELSKAWKGQIQLIVGSNTSIIGLNADSGIKGGTISISGVSNIAIRNLTIQDTYDPFPDMEKNDGFNAEYDGICIQGESSNIWIDHCTFKDSFSNFNKVTTSSGSSGIKWQTYDGLCDIKGNSKNITVSYCTFMNHDKTMLIGSSDTETISVTRTITLHNNYYYNCMQRLPMVRKTNIHIFNNYFDADSSAYANSYAIGVRAEAKVFSEKNYFGNGIKYSHSGSTGTKGSLYSIENIDNSVNKGRTDQYTLLGSVPFTVPYQYEAQSASSIPFSVKANAGAGKWTVKQL